MTTAAKVAAVLGLVTALVSVWRVTTRPTRVPTAGPSSELVAVSRKCLQDRVVVVLGASYARGWNPSPVALINAGVSGEQSWEVRARYDRDVTPHRPDAVVIWGFINDIFRASWPEIDAAKQRVRESFESLVKQTVAIGAIPIVATEVTIRPAASFRERIAAWVNPLLGRPSYEDYVNRHVVDLNVWLRDFATEQRITLLDIQALLNAHDGQRAAEFANDDGSHLTPAAYDAITAYALPLIVGTVCPAPPPPA